MRLLDDADVHALLTPEVALAAMRRAFAMQAEGTLDAPPRTSVATATGRLVLTIGASRAPHGPAGFRAYHTGPDADTQLVAVFDGSSGELGGVVAGTALGELRTAAINAVALDALARPDARVLGVLGSGRQATGTARLALAARPFERVLVYSPTAEHRRALAASLAAAGGVEAVAVDTAEEAVRPADAVVAATTSREPVLEAGWLRPGTHVGSLGPKGRGASELPAAVGTLASRIATDSVAQAGAYPEPFFLDAADAERMVGLERVLAGELPGRAGADEVTLFCSVGLAGTEVVLAEELLARAAVREAGQATERGASVRLEPLTAGELDAYLAQLVPSYAADHVRAGNWAEADAEDRAWRQVRELLPQGVDTPGHELLHIVDRARGQRVGRVWTMMHQTPACRELFVLDLQVAPRHRRRGYGFAAMLEVEARARAGGAERLSLHVFGANAGARALYRRLGLQEADVTMAKRL